MEFWHCGRWRPVSPSESWEICQRSGPRFHVSSGCLIDLSSMERSDEKLTWPIRFSPGKTLVSAFQEMSSESLSEELLQLHWPSDDRELVVATAHEAFDSMLMSSSSTVSLAEWLHYWRLRLDQAPRATSEELTNRLPLLMQCDPQALQRRKRVKSCRSWLACSASLRPARSGVASPGVP